MSISSPSLDLPKAERLWRLRGKKADGPPLDSVKAELACRHLDKFIEYGWGQIDPSPFVPGWHLDAISEHLEAVSRRDITRLIINIPPRCTKSMAVAVAWPAWTWIDVPEERFLFMSYAAALSTRDSVKCRRLIQSPWYQKLLAHNGHRFDLVGDQNTKTRFENDANGYRISSSVGGMGTGEGGGIIAVDDPHNVDEGESETVRDGTVQWFSETMSTRLNDRKTGAFVIIMQRVHEGDLTGAQLAKDLGWEHLCIPAEYEGINRSTTSLNYVDPRTEVGESICEERFPPESLAELKEELGIYGTASQLQQRPTPREGGMFKTDNFEIVTSIPKGRIEATIRYWDKAATKDGGKRTAGVLMHRMSNRFFVVSDVVSGQWATEEREAKIKQTAPLDEAAYGKEVSIWIEQEPGSGGKDSALYTIRNLAGYKIKAEPATGDKATRAEPFSDQVNVGNVLLVKGDWNKKYMDELQGFPKGNFSDQVDGSSGAFNKLALKRKRSGTW